jgi:hypothetical protein
MIFFWWFFAANASAGTCGETVSATDWEQPVIQLQVGPLRTVASDVLVFARELFPEQSIQVASLMLLGFWGYPEFSGLSQSDPVSVFLFPSAENDYDWVACARMGENGAIRSSLSLQNLRTKEVGGWTFIGSREGPLAAAVESGPEGILLALAARPLENDFRLDIHPSQLARFWAIREKILLERLSERRELGDNLPVLSRFNFLENFIQQVDGLSVIGDFQKRTFLGSLRLSAREKSDLEYMLCAPGKEIDSLHIAGALPASGQLQLLFRYDPEKLCRLLELSLDQCLSYGMQGISKREVYNFLQEVLSSFTGTVASRFSDDGTVQRLVAMDVSQKRLGDWAEFACEKLLPVFAAQDKPPLPPGVDFQFSAEADREAFRHRGIPAISITVRTEGSFSVPGEEGPERIPFSFTDQLFFCSLGDAVAMANDEEAFREVVDDFLNGGPTVPSLADSMPFESDTIARSHVDLLKLFGLDEEGKGVDLTVRFREGSALIDFSLDGGDLGAIIHAIGDSRE